MRIKFLNNIKTWFKKAMGLDPTPTQIKLITFLRNNPHINSEDIAVTKRGSVKRSVESVRRAIRDK